MSNTKINLNRQSDLILTNALITNPSGLTQSDINGLVPGINQIKEDIDVVYGGLKSENNDRREADASLEELIVSEIKTEIEARAIADSSLEAKVSTEKGRIDAILDGSDVNLDQFAEVVTFVQGIDLENDQALLGAITSIESKHDAEVSVEISTRVSADDSLEDLIGSKVEALEDEATSDRAAREDADASLETYFQEEVDALDNAAVTDRANLSVEISNRETGDASVEQKMGEYVDSSMKQESNERATADTSLEELIGSEMKTEIEARATADSSLEAKVSTEKGRIDAILDGSTVDLDQFSEVVAFVQGIDLENDQALLGAVTSIESKHDAEVSAEISSRVSADSSVEQKMGEYVDSSMKQEINERTNADSSLEELIGSEIKQEIKARKDVDASLEELIGSEMKAEIEAREKADSDLENKVDEVVARIESEAKENLKASNEADTSLEELIGSEIKAEITAREGADTSLETSLDTEISTRESIESAIKEGVNNALVEIKDMIMNAARGASFRLLTAQEGDGITTTFGATMNGQGAIYLNGLLQHQGVDYTLSTSLNGKGNPVVEFIFDEAPANGSQITIYGQDGAVNDDKWFGDLKPILGIDYAALISAIEVEIANLDELISDTQMKLADTEHETKKAKSEVNSVQAQYDAEVAGANDPEVLANYQTTLNQLVNEISSFNEIIDDANHNINVWRATKADKEAQKEEYLTLSAQA